MVEGFQFSFTLEQVKVMYDLLDLLETGPAELSEFYFDLRDNYYEILAGLRDEFDKFLALVKE